MSGRRPRIRQSGRWAGPLMGLVIAACAPPRQQCLSSRDCATSAACVNGACVGSGAPVAPAGTLPSPQQPPDPPPVRADGLKPLCFETRSPMTIPRGNLMVAEHNGLIYAFGGDAGQITKIAEVYHPAHDTWRRIASMPTARQAGAAVAVGDQIHVIGGKDQQYVHGVHEVYWPAINTWTQLDPPPIDWGGVARVSAVVIGTHIYVSLVGPNAQWAIYDTTEQTWQVQALTIGATHSLISVGDHIYGIAEGPVVVDYSVNEGAWASLAPLVHETNDPSIPAGRLAWQSEQLYYVGATLQTRGLGGDTLQHFPDSARWQYSGTLSIARRSFGLAQTAGRLYVAGGFTKEQSGQYIPSAALEVSCQ